MKEDTLAKETGLFQCLRLDVNTEQRRTYYCDSRLDSFPLKQSFYFSNWRKLEGETISEAIAHLTKKGMKVNVFTSNWMLNRNKIIVKDMFLSHFSATVWAELMTTMVPVVLPRINLNCKNITVPPSVRLFMRGWQSFREKPTVQ